MLKMRFEATMLLKTNTNAFGTKPFFRFKAKCCAKSRNWCRSNLLRLIRVSQVPSDAGQDRN